MALLDGCSPVGDVLSGLSGTHYTKIAPTSDSFEPARVTVTCNWRCSITHPVRSKCSTSGGDKAPRKVEKMFIRPFRNLKPGRAITETIPPDSDQLL